MVIQQFLDEEDGHTSIEYALIASMVSVVILSALLAIRADLDRLFTMVAESIGPSSP